MNQNDISKKIQRQQIKEARRQKIMTELFDANYKFRTIGELIRMTPELSRTYALNCQEVSRHFRKLNRERGYNEMRIDMEKESWMIFGIIRDDIRESIGYDMDKRNDITMYEFIRNYNPSDETALEICNHNDKRRPITKDDIDEIRSVIEETYFLADPILRIIYICYRIQNEALLFAHYSMIEKEAQLKEYSLLDYMLNKRTWVRNYYPKYYKLENGCEYYDTRI